MRKSEISIFKRFKKKNFCFFSYRTATNPTTINDNQDFLNGRHNRAIEIVIDSIHSLEGAVNNFDQLVFGLIYGRLSTRTEFESIEVNKIKTLLLL